MDPLELQEPKDLLESLGAREKSETLERKVLLVLLVSQENLAYPESKEGMESLEPQDPKGHREKKETLDPMDHLAQQVLMANMVTGDPLDQRVRKESLAIKVVLDQGGHPE